MTPALRYTTNLRLHLPSRHCRALQRNIKQRWKTLRTGSALARRRHATILSGFRATRDVKSAERKKLGRWREAEELEERFVEVSRRVLGDEHLHTLTSILTLAHTYFQLGRYREAEKLQEKVVEVRKRVLGEEHPGTLSSIHLLADIHNNLQESDSMASEGPSVSRLQGPSNMPPTVSSSKQGTSMWGKMKKVFKKHKH